MSDRLADLLERPRADVYDLHAANVNPQFVKVLRTIGFDRGYVRGEGAYLYDEAGQRYLDMLGGYGVFNLGRNHPTVVAAVRECLERRTANLVQMDCSRLSGHLAGRLIERAPSGIGKVFFTNSGTEAVEGAIKFARAATGRPGIVFLDHAFHGLSTGSLALNGGQEFRDGFGDLLPCTRRIPFGDLDALRAELDRGDVAAFICEAIQGKGVQVSPEGYLAGARRMLSEAGALLVLDEVQAGFGRTGRFFAFEHWGVCPDIITMAKGLSGGLVPVGAILTTDAVHRRTFSNMNRCVVHSSTFGENDLAMAAGLAALDALDADDLMATATRIGERIMAGVRELSARHPIIKEVRGKGLMIGIQFGPPDRLLARLKWKLVGTIEKGLFTQVIVMNLLERHHILSQVAGHGMEILKLIPPLCLTEHDADQLVAALDATLEESSVSSAMWEMGRNLGKLALQER